MTEMHLKDDEATLTEHSRVSVGLIAMVGGAVLAGVMSYSSLTGRVDIEHERVTTVNQRVDSIEQRNQATDQRTDYQLQRLNDKIDRLLEARSTASAAPVNDGPSHRRFDK